MTTSEQTEHQDGEPKSDLKIGIDSETIISSIGKNNKYLDRIRYKFGQVDPTHIVLSLTDALDGTRYSVPEHVVNKSEGNAEQRLDQSNLKIRNEPFSFQFTNARTGETMIDT